MRRILNFLGYSYRKPRPIPEKSATPEEQEKFMLETNELVADLTKKGLRYTERGRGSVPKGVQRRVCVEA